MEKFLVTGASGFVARHFFNFLNNDKRKAEVLGLDLSEPDSPPPSSESVRFCFQKINLLNREALQKSVSDFNPDHVLHLASFSSVRFSWNRPAESFCNNTNIFLNLIEAIRGTGSQARILSVGSSEEYGGGRGANLFSESDLLQPASPYGIARVSQEMIGVLYAKSYGLNLVLTRSFNHLGPWQRPAFVIASFVSQFVAAKRQGASSVDLLTGNLDITRDFTDVRDVVRAYDLLLKKGRPGEVYNVCSGRAISLREIIVSLETILGIRAKIVTDQSLIRPKDPREIVGDLSKIREELGWEPKIPLQETLREMVETCGT